MGTSSATRQSFSSVHSSNFIADLLVYHQDRTLPQSQQRSSATAFAATRGSGSCRRRTTELVVRLIVWLVAQCLSPSRISLLIYLSPTSIVLDLAAANVVFPRIARRRGTQVHSSFRRATGYGPPKPGGKHQYLGTNARPVHQQTALHLVHGVYGCPLHSLFRRLRF